MSQRNEIADPAKGVFSIKDKKFAGKGVVGDLNWSNKK